MCNICDIIHIISKVPTFPKKNDQVLSCKFKNSSKIECTFDAVGFTEDLGAICPWIYIFFFQFLAAGGVGGLFV